MGLDEAGHVCPGEAGSKVELEFERLRGGGGWGWGNIEHAKERSISSVCFEPVALVEGYAIALYTQSVEYKYYKVNG